MLICNVGSRSISEQLADHGIQPRLLSFDTERGLWLAYFSCGNPEALTCQIEAAEDLYVVEAVKAATGEALIYLTDDPQVAYKSDWNRLSLLEQDSLIDLYHFGYAQWAGCHLATLANRLLITEDGSLTSYGELVVESGLQ